jgi:hypothetical protein
MIDGNQDAPTLTRAFLQQAWECLYWQPGALHFKPENWDSKSNGFADYDQETCN